ncbi:MAG: arylsulfatase [Planctomycetes bacterium]|nr:arylsulfatase [Planctomycetota bacterium]
MRPFAAVALALAAVAVAQERARPGRPNVILLMTDDQGYGDLGCHGNPVIRTPNLDRLAGESVRFTDFHVAPMCTPTRGQLMSGVDALRNGAMNVSSGRALLRRECRTLPELLRAGGYATGIFGKWHLGDNYPFRPQDRGFDTTLCFLSSFINAVPNPWDNDYFDDIYWRDGRPEQFEGYTTDVFFREAIEWIEARAAAGEPFFCYLPTAAPHAPLFVPERYRLAAAARLAAEMPGLDLPPRQRESLARFLGMIENVDDNIGRLERVLRERGLRDDTIFVFLTDNGSTMGPRYYNAGMRGGKVTLWEGGHRVPLFVRWPNGGLGAPRDVAALTEVQDVLPTLLELCAVEPPGDLAIDGTSLAPLLRGDAATFPDRTLVVHYSRMPFDVKRRAATGPSIPTRDGAAVMWRHWRMLEDEALYDLEVDPAQQHDVAAQHPEVAERMRRQLYEWWESVAPRLNEPSRVVIGSEFENPSRLTACEWFDVFVDQQRQVRVADPKFGAWQLEVAGAGDYEIELRRWPRDVDLPIGQGMPATAVTDGTFVAGRSLPVAGARLRVGAHEATVDVAADAVAATFRVHLEAGPVELQTWFLDGDGAELTGAYYVYVTRR